MRTPVINVRGLGKAYRIGMVNPKHTNFRETLMEAVKTPFCALCNDLGVMQPVSEVSDAIRTEACPFLDRA